MNCMNQRKSEKLVMFFFLHKFVLISTNLKFDCLSLAEYIQYTSLICHLMIVISNHSSISCSRIQLLLCRASARDNKIIVLWDFLGHERKHFKQIKLKCYIFIKIDCIQYNSVRLHFYGYFSGSSAEVAVASR